MSGNQKGFRKHSGFIKSLMFALTVSIVVGNTASALAVPAATPVQGMATVENNSPLLSALKTSDVGFGYYGLTPDEFGKDTSENTFIQSDFVNTIFGNTDEYTLNFCKENNTRVWVSVHSLYDKIVNNVSGWQDDFDAMVDQAIESGAYESVLGWYLDEPIDNNAVKTLSKYAKDHYGKRFFVCFAVSSVAHSVYNDGVRQEITPDQAQYLTDVAFDMYWGSTQQYETVINRMRACINRNDVYVWYIADCFGSKSLQTNSASAAGEVSGKIAHINLMYDFLKQETKPGGLLCFAYDFDPDPESENLCGMKQINAGTSGTWDPLLAEQIRIGREICTGQEGISDVYPSIYASNFQVIQDFTKLSDLPWEYNGMTWLVDDSGTVSPDGQAAKLYTGYWGKNSYRFENLDFSDTADNAEAIAFWYKFPFSGIQHIKFSIQLASGAVFDIQPELIYSVNASIEHTITTQSTWDGSTDMYTPLQGEGYVVITADTLSKHGAAIKDVVKIHAFSQGVEPWPYAASYWYADDIGVVQDYSEFKAALMQPYNLLGLQSALATAEGKDRLYYTPESWQLFQSVKDTAKLRLEDYKSKSIFYPRTIESSDILTELIISMIYLKDAPPAPSYYDDNYFVVRDFTDPTDKPWDTNNLAQQVKSTNTPSPDHTACELPIGYWGKNDYFLQGLDFSNIPGESDAIVFWFQFPFNGCNHVKITVETATRSTTVRPIVISESNGTFDITTTELATWDGSTDYFAPIKFQGYLIITANDLNTCGISIQDVIRIRFFMQGVEPWPNNGTYWYIDDVGAIRNLDVFINNLTQPHNVSELQEALEYAETFQEIYYSPESWASFQSSVNTAKSIFDDLYDQPIFYKAHLAKAMIHYAKLDIYEAADELETYRNYTVLRDFTQAADQPWEYNGQTWLVENAETPSPDHRCAKLIVGYWGKNAYRFENLDFSKVSPDTEAIVFWYSFPYAGVSHTEFSIHTATKNAIVQPQVFCQSNGSVSYLTTNSITWDGTTGSYAPLQNQGFVVITADSLLEIGIRIQDVIKISAFAQGVEPWPYATTYWYADDIGTVKSLDIFKSSLESSIE